MSHSSIDFPTVRCWNETNLARLIRSSASALGLKNVIPSAGAVIDQLVALNLAKRVELESSAEGPSNRFAIIDFSTAENHDLDPLELAQALSPRGVLCYFGALSYHGLTTQVPPFYHVAELTMPEAGSSAIPNVKLRREPTAATIDRETLGSLAFIYEGSPIYTTKRIARTVAGTKIYQQGPRTSYRMTSIEQSLLDTLHRPKPCGGPSVVFEAWENGISQLKDEELVRLLEGASPVLKRRAGAMLERNDYRISPTLESLLLDTPQLQVPLLPGYAFGTTMTRWGVLV